MGKLGGFLKSNAPLAAVVLLATKTVATAAGLENVAQIASICMSVFALGVDPDTGAAVVAGAGAAYKVFRKLSPAPAPPAVD